MLTVEFGCLNTGTQCQPATGLPELMLGLGRPAHAGCVGKIA